MEEVPHCAVHRRRPVEYVCLSCDNFPLCEPCRLEHERETGHAPEDCKEVGQALMHQIIQYAGGRQAKELAKEMRKGLNELETGLLQEIDLLQSSLVQTEERRKMQKLGSEGKYAELYFYVKSLPVGDANSEAAIREPSKHLLKVLDTAYEWLEKVRNKIDANAGDTLAERIAKMREELKRSKNLLQDSEEERKRLADLLRKSEMERNRLAETLQDNEEDQKKLAKTLQKNEEERRGLVETLQKNEEELKRLTETLQKIEESLRSCLAKCNALISGFKATFDMNKAAIDKQQDLQKKKDALNALYVYLNTIENGFDSALTKFNAQLGTNATEVREFRRILGSKGEEVSKCIADKKTAEEKDEKKKPPSAEKGECVYS